MVLGKKYDIGTTTAIPIFNTVLDRRNENQERITLRYLVVNERFHRWVNETTGEHEQAYNGLNSDGMETIAPTTAGPFHFDVRSICKQETWMWLHAVQYFGWLASVG